MFKVWWLWIRTLTYCGRLVGSKICNFNTSYNLLRNLNDWIVSATWSFRQNQQKLFIVPDQQKSGTDDIFRFYSLQNLICLEQAKKPRQVKAKTTEVVMYSCTLHTAQCILHTALCKMHAAPCILRHSEQVIQYTAQGTLHTLENCRPSMGQACWSMFCAVSLL